MQLLQNLIQSASGMIQSLTPSMLLLFLGGLLLAMVCASIGWILRGRGEQQIQKIAEARGNQAIALLPGPTKQAIDQEFTDPQALDQTIVLDQTAMDASIGRHKQQVSLARPQTVSGITSNRSSSHSDSTHHSTIDADSTLLDSTIAVVAGGIKSLSRSSRKSTSELQTKARDLELELRSTRYKLKTREAELHDFRTRSTDELRDAKERIEKLRAVKESLKGSQAHIVQLTEKNRQLQNELDTSNKDKASSEALKTRLAASLEDLTKSEQLYKEAANKNETLVQSLGNELADLKKANSELIAKNTDAQKAIADVESEAQENRHAHSQILAEREAEIQKLTSSEAGNSSKISGFETRLIELNNELQAQKNIISARDSDIVNFKTRATAAEQKNISLSEDLSNTKAELKSLQKTNTELLTSKSDLEHKLQAIESRRSDFRDETAREITQLRERISGLQNLETANLNQANTIKKLEGRLDEWRNTKRELEQQSAKLIHANTESEALKLKFDDLDHRLAEEASAKTKLESENSQLSSSLKQARSKRDELQQALESANTKNHDLRKQVTEIEHLRRESRQQHEKVAAIEESKKTAEQQLLEKDERIDQLKAKSAGLIAEVERAKSTLETEHRKYTSLLQQTTDQESRLADLEKSRNNLQAEKHKLEQSLLSTKNELSQVKQETEKLKNSSAENDGIKKSMLELQKNYEETDEKLEEKLKELESYKKQISDNTSELNLAKKQNDSFRKQIEETRLLGRKQKERIAELELNTAAYTEKYKAAQEENAALSQTFKSMEANHSDALKKETDRINQLLSAAETNSTTILQEKEKLQKELLAANLQLQKISDTKEQLQSDLLAKTKEVESIKTQQAANEKNRSSQLAELDGLRNQIETIKGQNAKEVKELQQQIETTRTSAAAELENARDQINKTEVTAKKTTESLSRKLQEAEKESVEKTASLKNKIASLEEKLSTLKQTVEQSKQSLIEKQNAVAKLGAEKEQLRSELNTNKADMEKSQQLLATIKNSEQKTQQSHRTEIEQLQNQLAKFEANALSADEESEALQRKLADSHASVKKYEYKIKNLQNQLTKQKVDSVDESTLKATIAERDSAQDKLKRLRTDNEQLANDIAGHKSKSTELERKLAANTEKLNALQEQKENLNKDREAKQTKVQELNIKLEQALAQCQQLERTVETERSHHAELQSLAKSERQKVLQEVALAKDADAKAKETQKQVEALQKAANDKLAKQTDEIGELRKNLVEREKTIVNLQREQEQFVSLKGLVAERQADIESLRSQIEKLAILEAKLKEKDSALANTREELDRTAAKARQYEEKIGQIDKQLKEANKALSNRIQIEQLPANDQYDEKLNSVELKRLQSQVQSLTIERDLGLERVRDLSEVSKTLDTKNKQIRELRALLNDSKINDRELDVLRGKLDRQEADLRNKKITIEQLRKELTRVAIGSESNKKPLTPANKGKPVDRSKQPLDANLGAVSDGGVGIAEVPAATRTKSQASTSTKRSQAVEVAKPADKRTPIFTAPKEKDDLKKIKGIGPVMETTLNELGISSFRQIAEFDANDIIRVTEALDAFPGRIERDDWVGGARKEYIQKYKSRD